MRICASPSAYAHSRECLGASPWVAMDRCGLCATCVRKCDSSVIRRANAPMTPRKVPADYPLIPRSVPNLSPKKPSLIPKGESLGGGACARTLTRTVFAAVWMVCCVHTHPNTSVGLFDLGEHSTHPRLEGIHARHAGRLVREATPCRGHVGGRLSVVQARPNRLVQIHHGLLGC